MEITIISFGAVSCQGWKMSLNVGVVVCNVLLFACRKQPAMPQSMVSHYSPLPLPLPAGKSLDQINLAGRRAAALYPGTIFWEQNWRKGGLQDRRNQLLKEHDFYNQQYCGCEFSMRRLEEKRIEKTSDHNLYFSISDFTASFFKVILKEHGIIILR